MTINFDVNKVKVIVEKNEDVAIYVNRNDEDHEWQTETDMLSLFFFQDRFALRIFNGLRFGVSFF